MCASDKVLNKNLTIFTVVGDLLVSQEMFTLNNVNEWMCICCVSKINNDGIPIILKLSKYWGISKKR